MEISLEFLQVVFDHLQIGVVVIDTDDKIVLFNRKAGEMLQEDPQARVGSTIMSCHPRESDPAVKKLIDDIKLGVIDHYEGWINYQGRMLYEYIHPIRDPDGTYVGMIEELHDANERSQLMKRLEEWEDVHVSGIGKRAPRGPEYNQEDGE
jgi:PAS domain S-box-containing protein